MTCTKNQIIESISSQTGFTKKQSSKIAKTLLDILKSTLESGEDVMISGFGKFQVKNKKARRWRNHITEKYQMLPPKKIVTFKCSGKLRDIINGR